MIVMAIAPSISAPRPRRDVNGSRSHIDRRGINYRGRGDHHGGWLRVNHRGSGHDWRCYHNRRRNTNADPRQGDPDGNMHTGVRRRNAHGCERHYCESQKCFFHNRFSIFRASLSFNLLTL